MKKRQSVPWTSDPGVLGLFQPLRANVTFPLRDGAVLGFGDPVCVQR